MLIVLGFVAVWGIGYAIGRTAATEPLPDCCLTCLHDHKHSLPFGSLAPVCCDHWGLSSLQAKITVLESENKRLNFLYENLTRDKRIFHEYMAAHCGNCDRKFYAKTPKEQDVADLLKKITLTSQEIAERLDIKVI